MRKILTIAVLAAALVSCAEKVPLSVQLVGSERARCPEATFLDGLEGRLKWNYTTGLELKAFLDVYDRLCPSAPSRQSAPSRHSDPSRQSDLSCHSERSEGILSYVDAWYDAVIDSTGRIYNYKVSNYSTDHICPGRTLFRLYELTGKEKYRMAMDTLWRQLEGQPRTPEGGFWHKKVYPQQMWLDGLYMAEPFYAEYTARFVPDSLKAGFFADIARQFTLVAEHTFDPATGLYRHAWDASHAMFWADPETGQSDHAWGRALGWYCMAIVEVLPLLPEGTPGRGDMVRILRGIFDRLPDFADPETGLWYQVLDCPGREGNYLEATCNAMFAYAMQKGVRMGWLDIPAETARKTYESFVRTFISRDGDLVSLDRCCEVAGLGGKENRRGDYDYYIHERVRSNDPKGIGPAIWAALEYER